jgi:hypothetical protein
LVELNTAVEIDAMAAAVTEDGARVLARSRGN